MKAGARSGARLLRRAANAIDAAAKTQLWVMQHPRRDMAEDIDERYYAAQYLHWLAPLIAALPPGGRVLDLGCGYGRLALEIAARRPDGTVVGVDLAPPRSPERSRTPRSAALPTANSLSATSPFTWRSRRTSLRTWPCSSRCRSSRPAPSPSSVS
jgi:hypothetical protein